MVATWRIGQRVSEKCRVFPIVAHTGLSADNDVTGEWGARSGGRGVKLPLAYPDPHQELLGTPEWKVGGEGRGG